MKDVLLVMAVRLLALHMACIGQHADTVRTLLQLGLADTEDISGTMAKEHAKKIEVLNVFECK